MASVHTRTNKSGEIAYRVMFRIDGRQAQESFDDPASTERFTIAVDLIAIRLAAFGLLNPVAAALIHVGSETAFILNSARLIPGRRSR